MLKLLTRSILGRSDQETLFIHFQGFILGYFYFFEFFLLPLFVRFLRSLLLEFLVEGEKLVVLLTFVRKYLREEDTHALVEIFGVFFSDAVESLLSENRGVEDLYLRVHRFDCLYVGFEVAVSGMYPFEEVVEGVAEMLFVDELLVYFGNGLQVALLLFLQLVFLLLLQVFVNLLVSRLFMSQFVHLETEFVVLDRLEELADDCSLLRGQLQTYRLDHLGTLVGY